MNREELGHLLTVHARTMAGSLAIALIVVGVQIFMVTYGFAVFLETPPAARKGRHRYMVINLLLFIIPTLGTIPLFYRYFTMWWDSTSALDYGKRRGQQLLWAADINSIADNFSIIFGDALLLYRCYIVWADKKWVIITPALTYVASVVMCFVLTVEEMKASSDDTAMLWVTLLSLSLALNVMVTGLIAGRLIHARRRIAKLLGGTRTSSSSDLSRSITGASAILIESALPLTLLGVGCAAMQGLSETTVGGDPGTVTRIMVASYVFSTLYPAFVVLSPQIIIFRVTTGRSWIAGVHKTFTSDESVIVDSGTAAGSGGLVFANVGGETMKTVDYDHSRDADILELSSSRSPEANPELEKGKA